MAVDREYKLCDVRSSLYVQPRVFRKSLGTSLANIVVVYVDMGEIVDNHKKLLLHLRKPGRKKILNN